jgi:hypothetical protein
MLQALSSHENQRQPLQTSQSFQPDSPWILLRERLLRVNYTFTGIDSILDEPDADHIALTFHSDQPMACPTRLKIGVPMPDALRDYSAEVVSCRATACGFEIGLQITIKSTMDLLSLMRSNAWLSSHYND